MAHYRVVRRRVIEDTYDVEARSKVDASWRIQGQEPKSSQTIADEISRVGQVDPDTGAEQVEGQVTLPIDETAEAVAAGAGPKNKIR